MTKRILVIDDDLAVRTLFKLVLDDVGYIADAAAHGLQGIDMALAHRPDLIFLDLKMPGIDGIETFRRLKAIDNTLNIYIVTAFGNEYTEQLKALHDKGYEFQLAHKPLSPKQIRYLASSINRPTELNKLFLTLYIVSLNNESRILADQLTALLAATYQPGCWKLDVVEVLDTPEKALKHNIFATPMLVRDLPPPVLRLLGDLSKMPDVISAITSQHSHSSDTIVM